MVGSSALNDCCAARKLFNFHMSSASQPNPEAPEFADGAQAVQRLFEACEVPALADQIVAHLEHEFACRNVVLLWSADWPKYLLHAPEGMLSAEQLDALSALQSSPHKLDVQRNGLHGRWLCDGPGSARVLLVFQASKAAAAPSLQTFLQLAGTAIGRLLERNRLIESIVRLEKAERLQHALFKITDTASSELDMPTMLGELHRIVSSLMYAENFFIALHDARSDSVRFIYFADVEDSQHRNPDNETPMASLECGLTWYLIRDGRPLMGSGAQLREQVSGPLRVLGPDSNDFLGVPLLSGEHAANGAAGKFRQVRGALVVQSYVDRARYTADDQALLGFVASHILTALERKQAQEQLESRVLQRTRELTAEVQARQRGERLQTALYQMAQLAGTARNLQAFYVAVHGVIGALLDIRNLYIALLSADGTELQFAYWVDEYADKPQPRKLGRGITEYVLRTSKPMLADLCDPESRALIKELQERGELSTAGAEDGLCWLGVPLICDKRAVGVLAVQSYTAEVRYNARDQELLTFVSYQIASSLERKRAADALLLANMELEQRVHARTAQLHNQIAARENTERVLQQRNRDLEAANQRLAGTQSQLLQSEKMASVGQLAAGVAHEINNPIGYVHSNLNTLGRYVHDIFTLLGGYQNLANGIEVSNPELRQLHELEKSIGLAYIREDIGSLLTESLGGLVRVEKIVSDLKDFSHLDQAEWQIVDLHAGLESTLNVVAHELKYKAVLVKEYGQLPLVECLPFQLNQVFLNMLINAAHAIEGQGKITIRTGVVDSTVFIQFIDTGKGIEPASLKRIFEPFFTTKPIGVGTGLGLSVSYSIVRKHGGSIEIDSEVGKGSVFTIRLPVRVPREETATELDRGGAHAALTSSATY